MRELNFQIFAPFISKRMFDNLSKMDYDKKYALYSLR
jgi:hypothetical protein